MAERPNVPVLLRGPSHSMFAGRQPYDSVSNLDIRRFMPPFNSARLLLPSSYEPQRDISDIQAYEDGIIMNGENQFGEFMGFEQLDYF